MPHFFEQYSVFKRTKCAIALDSDTLFLDSGLSPFTVKLSTDGQA